MDYTVLINKNNLLDKDFVPSDLVITDNNENNFHNYRDPNQKPMVSKAILPFFLKMQEDAAKEGLHIIIDSGYRSYNYQKVVWDKYVLEKGLEEAKKFVALPGSSEHQSGLAFDVALIIDGKYTDSGLNDSREEIRWLFDNAHKYGFILRYPKNKESITGYNYEPWHYRFVGIDLATKLYLENITLEEYYERKLNSSMSENNMLNRYLDLYVDTLYRNQAIGASEDTKNLFTKRDYYDILYEVVKVINDNPDKTIEEMRDILFKNSGVLEAVDTLVNKRQMTPGMVFRYGTMNHTETIVAGNREEVTLDTRGNVVSHEEKMSEDTIFDLASVTKLFTSLSILYLVEKGEINLNDKITKYVPEFSNLSNVSIFDLLAFQKPLITEKRIDNAKSPEEAFNILCGIKVNENFNPDSNPYTDMGAMILKYVIERVSNMKYYDFLKYNIIKPCSMLDTYDKVPKYKLIRTVSTNLDYKILDSNKTVMTVDAIRGVPYDPKARAMKSCEGNLCGHAGLFASSCDMTSLAKGIIDGRIINDKYISELGKNRTGRLFDSQGMKKSVQYLGYLCYSKNPIQKESEVYHALSGRAFASPGWLGNQLTVDPINRIFTFMGSNRSHNRVTYVNPSVRPYVEVQDGNKTYITLPNGDKKIDASRFAWQKGTIIYPTLKLLFQYKMLEDLYIRDLEQDKGITRYI